MDICLISLIDIDDECPYGSKNICMCMTMACVCTQLYTLVIVYTPSHHTLVTLTPY